MHYLTKEEILLIHSIIIDETGGSHGVRDANIITSFEHSPRQHVFGKELYPTAFLKAAVYAREIITTHPFWDGNKRSGMTAAIVFLENNHCKIIFEEGEIEMFALKIIRDRLDINAIAAWLEVHTKKS